MIKQAITRRTPKKESFMQGVAKLGEFDGAESRKATQKEK